MIIRMSKNQLNAVSAINRKCSHYFKLNANLRRVESCRVCVTLCRVNCRPKWREKLTMFRDVSRVEWLFAVYRRSNASWELTNLWFYTRITFHYEFCYFLRFKITLTHSKHICSNFYKIIIKIFSSKLS